MTNIRISGTGCTLIDYVYNHIDFSGEAFRTYLSRKDGDGGLSPGRLVFMDHFEKFAGRPFDQILASITNGRKPDASNLGGPAVVAMIHAAQLSGENMHFSFCAALGNDNMAQEIKSIVKKTPLKSGIRFIEKEGRSPSTFVLSDPEFDNGHGERTFINNIGSAGQFKHNELPDDFFTSDILVLGGTALVPEIHDSLDSILDRTDPACYTIVNTVYDFRNEQKFPGKPWPLGSGHDSLKRIDLLIMDKEEAGKISGKNSLEESVKYFINSELRSFIITDGARPVWLYNKDASHWKTNIRKIPVSEQIIQDNSKLCKRDTTGAGDNFAGGVIFSIAEQISQGEQNPDIMEAAKWGVISGGFACSYIGGTYIENEPFEKRRKLEGYYMAYEKQVQKYMS